jgi:hypothetical protein
MRAADEGREAAVLNSQALPRSGAFALRGTNQNSHT